MFNYVRLNGNQTIDCLSFYSDESIIKSHVKVRRSREFVIDNKLGAVKTARPLRNEIIHTLVIAFMCIFL